MCLARSIGVAGTLAIIEALKTNRTLLDVFIGDGRCRCDLIIDVFHYCAGLIDVCDDVVGALADTIESNRTLKALSFHGV
jgi:hypothetical protein